MTELFEHYLIQKWQTGSGSDHSSDRSQGRDLYGRPHPYLCFYFPGFQLPTVNRGPGDDPPPDGSWKAGSNLTLHHSACR